MFRSRKDIYLQGFNNAVIRDVTTETTKGRIKQ